MGDSASAKKNVKVDTERVYITISNIKQEQTYDADREETPYDYFDMHTTQSSTEQYHSDELLVPRVILRKGKNESPERRAERLAKMSVYAAQRRANETPEQRAQRLKRMSENAANKRLTRKSADAAVRMSMETTEQCSWMAGYEPTFGDVKVEEDTKSSTEHYWQSEETFTSSDDPLSISRKGKRESPDDRAVRLAKMSAYAAQRLANETPEQRAQRLKRMSEYAAKRLACETADQRAKRLARMSEYAAKRLAKETPEQRQLRLTRMSAYAAKRHAMKKTIGSIAKSILRNEQVIDKVANSDSSSDSYKDS